MPELSPHRVATFLAMAAVLLLVGWNSLKSEGTDARSTGVNGSLSSGASVAEAGAGGRVKVPETSADDQPGLQVGSGSRRIVVDVSGEVKRPGVYGFLHGQRVIDAVRRAGGPTQDAYPSGINRAAVLADGQQVVVPSRSAGGNLSGPGATGGGSGVPGAGVADAPISLSTATQAQLEEIEGIGPVTALSILEFRDSQGGVSSIEELDQVTGIGPVTMEALRSRLQP
jgi:competence protein ComEA